MNYTSRKKRSVRPTYWILAGGTSFTLGSPPPRATGFISLYCCTGQYHFSAPSDTDFNRGTQIVYAKGYSETTQVLISDGGQWEWRRIVFTFKGNIYGNDVTFGADSNTVVSTSGASMGRVLNEVNGTALGALQDVMFRGKSGVDWINISNAPTDRERITVLSDKTRILRSGNDTEHFHLSKQWIPMNKNICYDDDQIQGGLGSSAYSVSSKVGMGDVYIFDFWQPRNTSGSTIGLNHEGTYYWHEK